MKSVDGISKQLLMLVMALAIMGAIYPGRVWGQMPLFEQVYTGSFEGEMQLMFGPRDVKVVQYVDIDGDGDLDLNFNGPGIFLNEGSNENPDYTFIDYPLMAHRYVSGNNYYYQNYLADYTGDGIVDLLRSYDVYDGYFYMWSYVELLVNEGTALNPDFERVFYESTGWARGSYADFNSDGLLDIIAPYTFWVNIGTFANPLFELDTTIICPPCPWGYMSPGDLDNDGDIDLLAEQGSNGIDYFRNIGTPEVPEYILEEQAIIAGIFSGDDGKILQDVDFDGDLDFIAGASLYENTGTAEAPEFEFADNNILSPFADEVEMHPAFADMDGDGDQDFFPYRESGNDHIIMCFENIGNAETPDWQLFSDSLMTIINYDYDFADMDDDGDLDLLTCYGNLYYENTGNAQNPHYEIGSVSFPGNGSFMEVMDLDFDGDYDVLTNYWGDIWFAENTGTASAPEFVVGDSTYLDTTFSGGTSWANYHTLGDFDSDGDYDVLVYVTIGWPYGGETYYRYLHNTGTAQNPEWEIFDYDYLGDLVLKWGTTCDLDNDGQLDIVATTSDHRSLIYLAGSGFLGLKSPSDLNVSSFSLSPIYPNPFNATAVIPFTLDRAGEVELTIFDITGRSVRVQQAAPLQGWYSAGMHEIVWDAGGCASGVYLVRLTADGKVSTAESRHHTGRQTAVEKAVLVK